MQPDIADPITATIPDFRRLSGIGRSRIYELLDTGELESVCVGKRRLILIDSYRRLIERLRDRRPVSATPSPPMPRRPNRGLTTAAE